jgi:hypothetical protein
MAALIGAAAAVIAAILATLLQWFLARPPTEQKAPPTPVPVVTLAQPFVTPGPDQISRTFPCNGEARPPSTVVICGLTYDPDLREPENEQIILCNKGDGPGDLTGWTISDNSGLYALPGGTQIAPGEKWAITGSTFNPTGNPNGVYLNNEHDLVRLVDDKGGEVDCRSW